MHTSCLSRSGTILQPEKQWVSFCRTHYLLVLCGHLALNAKLRNTFEKLNRLPAWRTNTETFTGFYYSIVMNAYLPEGERIFPKSKYDTKHRIQNWARNMQNTC